MKVTVDPDDAPVSVDRLPDLVGDLVKTFGLGAQPEMRRAFYEGVRRLVALRGDSVFALVSEARMQALSFRPKERGPDVRGRYFVRALAFKLREAGYAWREVPRA